MSINSSINSRINLGYLFPLALVTHLIAGVFSEGFYHWDEHFQIFEFANLKFGGISKELLPWEFEAKMRPWILPAVVTFTGKAMSLVGEINPFLLSSTIRMAAALLAFFSTWSFYLHTKDEFKSDSQKKIYFILSNFLWFIPFLHARTSAEMIGASLFLLALAQFFKGEKKGSLFISGLLFAFAFWIRFQLGFALLGIGIALLLFEKFKIRSLALMGLGFFLGIGLNLLIDAWGYGQFTFAPFEYVHQNIILGKSKNFGTSPWWDYLKWSLLKPGLPLGLLFLAGTFYYFKKFPKNVLTISTLLFLAAHLFVSHKEFRFLFPIMGLMPYFSMHLLADKFPALLEKRALKWTFWVFNAPALIFFTITPVNEVVGFNRFMESTEPEIQKLNIRGETNPYKLAGLTVSFYNSYKPEIITEDFSESGWFFSDRIKYARQLDEKGCKLKYNSNSFIATFRDKTWIKDKKKIWTLYKCQN